ncbi:Uncharacterised protein [Bordetella pertussis]|nr:Uncharacterised protein [Bordetella pertussis]CFW32420.1 Uncharacterised protein [Bordetella pertussis]
MPPKRTRVSRNIKDPITRACTVSAELKPGLPMPASFAPLRRA